MEKISIIISLVSLVVAGYALYKLKKVESELRGRIRSMREKINEKLPAQTGTNRRTTEPPSRNVGNQNTPREQSRRRDEFKQQEQRPKERPPQQQQQRNPQQKERSKQNTPKSKPLPMPDINLEQLSEQEAPVRSIHQPEEMTTEFVPRTKYAIIPEDGIIREHQLQVYPDSDSYIEVDMPDRQGNLTGYRFNLSGNQAFVISQGIDRLENAFDFDKPTNRIVHQIIQKGDGVLTRIDGGWRVQEKAKIDFR